MPELKVISSKFLHPENADEGMLVLSMIVTRSNASLGNREICSILPTMSVTAQPSNAESCTTANPDGNIKDLSA